MSNLTVFQFQQNQVVRTIFDKDGEPWFVAADVLDALGLDRKALERLDDDEKGVSSIHTLGGAQDMTVVNESGLYNLILGSRKPQAKAFKRWVTHEVLPAIRKTGSYTVGQESSTQNPPTLLDIQKQARQSRGLADTMKTRVAALIEVQRMIAAVPGVKPAMAAAVALNVIEAETGMRMDAFRAALPRNSEPMATSGGNVKSRLGKARRMAGDSIQLSLRRSLGAATSPRSAVAPRALGARTHRVEYGLQGRRRIRKTDRQQRH